MKGINAPLVMIWQLPFIEAEWRIYASDRICSSSTQRFCVRWNQNVMLTAFSSQGVLKSASDEDTLIIKIRPPRLGIDIKMPSPRGPLL